MLTTRRPLHVGLRSFVDWIRTDSSKEDSIRDQAGEIRQRVKGQATKDGLIVRSMPWSGSFAKRTGIRRHLQGATPVEGQDVDIPVVVSPKTKDDEALESLLPRFYAYLDASYPNTPKKQTKSSIKLDFVRSKVSYDIVPMLATTDAKRQVIIRAGGERRETSVQNHIEFIKARTRDSALVSGRVSFNEMVRLLKWWREVKCQGQTDAYPSILIDQLAAHAYRAQGVDETYPATLARWFGFLAHEVERRAPIYFDDYVAWARPPLGSPWAVIDPVTRDNNVAGHLSNVDIDVLGQWLSEATDDVLQAIAADNDDDVSAAFEALVPVFGRHIIHNS